MRLVKSRPLERFSVLCFRGFFHLFAVGLGRIEPLKYFFMDQYDANRPYYGPRSGDVKFRWSVGVYYQKKRTIIA